MAIMLAGAQGGVETTLNFSTVSTWVSRHKKILTADNQCKSQSLVSQNPSIDRPDKSLDSSSGIVCRPSKINDEQRRLLLSWNALNPRLTAPKLQILLVYYMSIKKNPLTNRSQFQPHLFELFSSLPIKFGRWSDHSGQLYSHPGLHARLLTMPKRFFAFLSSVHPLSSRKEYFTSTKLHLP